VRIVNGIGVVYAGYAGSHCDRLAAYILLSRIECIGRTQLNLTQCQCRHQSSVNVHLVQHVNCTVSDLVTSSPVYNDPSPSDIVL